MIPNYERPESAKRNPRALLGLTESLRWERLHLAGIEAQSAGLRLGQARRLRSQQGSGSRPLLRGADERCRWPMITTHSRETKPIDTHCADLAVDQHPIVD